MKQFFRFAGYILLGILITIAGFIIYFNMSSTGKLDPISFVPQNAVIVIESENTSKTLSDLNKPAYNELIKPFPFISETLNALNNEKKFEWIKSILKDKKATFSIHPSPSQKEEILVIVDIDK